jgi:hypothetical protein
VEREPVLGDEALAPGARELGSARSIAATHAAGGSTGTRSGSGKYR